MGKTIWKTFEYGYFELQNAVNKAIYKILLQRKNIVSEHRMDIGLYIFLEINFNSLLTFACYSLNVII